MKQLVARKYEPETGFTTRMVHGEVKKINGVTVIEISQGKRKIYLEKTQAMSLRDWLNQTLVENSPK